MWIRTFFGFVLYIVVHGVEEKSDDVKVSRQVSIESGDVIGYKNEETGIYEFRSIPYAKAPTGDDKFKAPLPAPVWEEPLEAVNRDIICPQVKFLQMQLNKTTIEDCLIANVYVPDTEDKNLPVVVYVHGGAFQIGFGDWMVPRELAIEHNIIVVTFNYRLGVHGFLCLGTEDAPGNAGLKDQLALLKWVKTNIASFGGKADDVTIAGYSAGATSVDLLRLSKAADGLFNRVIAESGANNAAAAIQPKPITVAKWFAKYLEFTEADNVYALEEFYKTATYEQLTSDSFLTRTDSTFGFTPCVERRRPNSTTEAIITESPIKTLKKGNYRKVPLLYGFTNMEGLLRADFFELWVMKMNEKFTDFLPADLKLTDKEEKEQVAKQVKEFYFGKKPLTNDSILVYVDYFTDVIFAYPMIRAVKLGVENGDDQIYLYEYSFVDENTPFVPLTNVRGANHCAQTQAVFGVIPAVDEIKKPTEEFKKMSSIMRYMWANFIKIGKPVPEGSPLPSWPPVSSDWSPHMSINSDLEMKESLLEHRMRFWDELYSKYYRHPIPPVMKSKKKPPTESEHTEL